MDDIETIDGQMLCAFIDGHLDATHSEAVIKAMDADPDIREQVFQLRRAKDLVKLGFSNVTAPSSGNKQPALRKKYMPAIAASITFLAVSLMSATAGYLLHGFTGAANNLDVAAAVQEQSEKIILHISKSDSVQFSRALDYAEKFLAEHQHSNNQIDVVAHAGGLDLMRADVSPVKSKIISLMDKYDNIHFIACAGAIKMFTKKNGVAPDIIEGVGTDYTAFDHIVGRLQRGGWKYVKIESLMKI